MLVTKAGLGAFEATVRLTPAATYNELAYVIVVPGSGRIPQAPGVVVLTAGTADLPVAEEAAVTAELMGSEVVRVNDVGIDRCSRRNGSRYRRRRRGSGFGPGGRRSHQHRLRRQL